MSAAKFVAFSLFLALPSSSVLAQNRTFSLVPDAAILAAPAAVSSSATRGADAVLESSALPDPNQQEPDPEPAKKKKKKKARKERPRSSDKLQVHRFSTLAVGIKASTLGAGVEVATPLSRSLNLRVSGYYMLFDSAFSIDGINYSTKVNFRSGQMNVDWFPFHNGFHISPGVLYFRNGLSGSADIDPGKPFSLSDVSYINSIDDPVSGTASITYAQHLAPSLTFGFSNIIPRSGKHFTVPFEIGAAYTQPAAMDVKLAGLACTVQGCFNAATDPGTQANLRSEISDINDSIKKVPLFPIVSLGFAFRF
jgi:hypothetical protein